jgi:hypothetical protein
MYQKYVILVSLISFFGSSLVAEDPRFSLHNKSGQPIAVHFFEGEKIRRVNEGPKDFHNWPELDTKQNIVVQISHGKNKGEDHYVCVKANGKTIYINWDPKRYPQVYVQQGTWGGLSGKTELGYSTKANINKNDIIQGKDCK